MQAADVVSKAWDEPLVTTPQEEAEGEGFALKLSEVFEQMNAENPDLTSSAGRLPEGNAPAREKAVAQIVAKRAYEAPNGSPKPLKSEALSTPRVLVMNQFVHKNLPYDPFDDFVPITLTAKTISVLAVSAARGPQSVKELMARAKAQPGKLNYGAGTITAQLMGHLFHKAAGLDIVYVPFKGTPETVNGLLTGSVELIYAANQIVAPLIVGGQVRALAKLDRDAPPSMADIPTLAEAAGLPDLEDISVWLGLVAPKGTPKPIIEKIHAEVAKVLTDPAIKEKSERTGNYPVTNTPDEFSAFIRKEARRWEKVIKEAGIKFD